MKKIVFWLPVLILLSKIAGCGLKGPLYAPSESNKFVEEKTTTLDTNRLIRQAIIHSSER